MGKVQNGALLIGIGMALNIFGRLVGPSVKGGSNIIIAAGFAILMIASAVLVLFGCFRLIVGLINSLKSMH